MGSPVFGICRESNQLFRQYDTAFAGQPRASRNLAELQSITAAASTLVQRLEGVPREQRDALPGLLTNTRASRDFYLAEVGAVEEAQRLGPTYPIFARLSTHAAALITSYNRLFSGRPRLLQDSVVLESIIERLSTIHGSLRELAAATPSPMYDGDALALDRCLNELRIEYSAILDLEKADAGPDSNHVFAALINEQLRAWRRATAGRPAARLRPRMVQTRIRCAERLLERLQHVAVMRQPDPVRERNAALLRGHLDLLRQVVDQLATERAKFWPAVLLKALADAARALYRRYEDEYVGRDVLLISIGGLESMCDELHELLCDVDELDPQRKEEGTEGTLDSGLTWILRMEQTHHVATMARNPRRAWR
jgi:hypothetical protein